MGHYDIIVVGGGLNSLVSASILGKSGKKVLILEAKDQVGGMAVTSEFAPKYKCNMLSDTIKWIDPRVMEQLDLVSEDLELVSPDIVRIALDQNGQHISFHQDLNQTAKSIANHSDKDAKSWQTFTTYIDTRFRIEGSLIFTIYAKANKKTWYSCTGRFYASCTNDDAGTNG